MNSITQQQISDNLRPLRQRYIQNLQERIQDLNRLIRLCEENLLSDEDRQSLRSHAHKLAGTGKTYGFQSISENARILEEALIYDPRLESERIGVFLRRLIADCMSASQEKFEETQAPVKNIQEGVSPSTQHALPLLLTIDDDHRTPIIV